LGLIPRPCGAGNQHFWKDVILMRTRETHINVRTTLQEKVRFERNAHRCGLSLSEYLRKLENGHEPKEALPAQFAELIRLLSDLHNDFRDSGDVQCARLLAQVLMELHRQILPEKRGGCNGDDENLAGS